MSEHRVAIVGPTLDDCIEKFDQFLHLCSNKALQAEVQKRQGLASNDPAVNVPVTQTSGTQERIMANEQTDDELLETYRQSRQHVLMAAHHVGRALKFFQVVEVIMAGAAADVIQALDQLKDKVGTEDTDVQALITLIKAKPSEQEMQQIRSKIAEIQGQVDSTDAAATGAAGSGSDTGTGSTGGDTGTGSTGTGDKGGAVPPATGSGGDVSTTDASGTVTSTTNPSFNPNAPSRSA
jgi:hypothetical protein